MEMATAISAAMVIVTEMVTEMASGDGVVVLFHVRA
jgi:hypothetical protein